MRYPNTRTVEAVEEVAGLRYPDPYRWLEDDSAEVRAWQRAQADIASSYVRQWPHFARVRTLVETFTPAMTPTVPRFAGGRWFRAEASSRVVIADEPFGAGRVVVDVAGLGITEGTPMLSWLSPSPDGAVLAFGVCTDGSERNRIWLFDVAGGSVRADAPPHILDDGWLGVTWLPDSGGFFYRAPTGGGREYRHTVFLHRLGAPAPTEPEPIPLPDNTMRPTLIQVSPDSRWAVAAHGTDEPLPVAVRDLADADAPWRPFVTDVDGLVAGHIIDDHYFAVTDVGAGRGRLVAIALNERDPNDPSNWREIVPESDAVMRTVTPVGDLLYLTELVDTYSRVRIFDRAGRAAGQVPLPAAGAVDSSSFSLRSLAERSHPEEFLFSFSTLVDSPGIYRHRPGADEVELLDGAEVSIDDSIVADHWATSSDGTRIPYHTVRLASTDTSRPAPTLIYAYGGFNAPLLPAFPGAMAAFVAAGGVFVHAHLRGGAEFGKAWREAGRFSRKQNCYDDLYAIATDLIARDVTTSDMLGVTGESNGGLMTGVAITQRPELWKVAVARVPMLDLIGGLRTPNTIEATRIDRGDPDDPNDIRRLAGYSPYHQVTPGTNYPAVFITAGAADTRCPPWHAGKWGARMQAAQAGDAPILIAIREGAGHGQATPRAIASDDYAEWLSFVMHRLDMNP